MGFVLTEDQELIRKTARSFVQEHLPTKHLRKLRDENEPVGFSRPLWKELAATGLVGVTLPEKDGGGGLGQTELGLVLQEMGRTLAPTPLMSTVLLSANTLLLTGRNELLPAIAEGLKVLAFAHDEGSRFDRQIKTRATRNGDGWRLIGEKAFVLDGHVADALLVIANIDDRPAIFLVPRGLPGLGIRKLSTIDSRNVARIVLDRVDVPQSALLKEDAAEILERVFDRATAGLCAEMLGSIEELLAQTISYLKTRQQFGVPIGSFQALKHRAAQMFCEIELSKSIVVATLQALDENKPDATILVSTAKARLNDTCNLVASEAVQMHGGIGVTDELDIGLFYKRMRVASTLLGDSAYHRDRFAKLSGY